MVSVVTIAAGCNGVGFLLTAFLETHKITDLVGVGTFVAASSTLLAAARENNNHRAILIDAGIIIWGVRLGGFLFNRVLRLGHDDRLKTFFRAPGEPFLDATRSRFPIKLFAFWTIQAIWAILCMLPVAFLHSQPPKNLDTSSTISLGLGLIAILLEAIADWQKYSYRNNPVNSNHWCDVGLWSLARYPNYFSEMLFWSSVYGACFSALPLYQRALAAISPCFVVYILKHLSGIPLLEKKHEKLYGDLAAYKAYKSRTNLLVPLPFKLF